MGLYNFPSPIIGGVLPVLVMNTVLSVALLKNVVRSVLQVMGTGTENPPNLVEDHPFSENLRNRKISVTLFRSLCNNGSGITRSSCGGWSSLECCVCLCGFEADEEVSELSCKHFFHKGCLEKWMDHKHSTCPLCRSTLC
ncbi:hypothetical protein HHK36_007471 [Tetracentron sinense]|uniref:RING-type domain-containing protein n=1 Tax=Tetracentron sinense TaxID=13715 RepID=A0A834ZTJ8_TETSI|nr:hypothetical protein HHK36_007471 [Tetracentron sinense]